MTSSSTTTAPFGPAESTENTTPWQLLRRMLITLFANMIAVHVASWLLPGFQLDDHGITTAAFIGAFGAVVAPLVVRLAFPIIVYSFGLVSLLINVLAVLVAAELFPELVVDGWRPALGVSIIVVLVGNSVSWLLSLDDEGTFTRAVVRRQVRRTQHVEHTDDPGVLFLEIDGCSHGVMQRAMRAGWVPNLTSWLASTHRLERWHTDLSSQTGASQAGLLLGSNEGIVAFRWWDRERDSLVATSSPADAMRLEDELSSGNGLLASGGASRNNIFSGDAEQAALTLSTIKRRGGASRAWGPFLANPNNVLRTILLALSDMAHELLWAMRYRRRGVQPRLEKGWRYLFMRAATNVVLRDMATEMVVADVVRGAPAVYATFVGYDEVAHHDGVERPPALEQLRLLDRTFARIARARRHAPRPYHVVVLSDHGQSQGATFLQRYGITLEDHVHSLVGNEEDVEAFTQDIESAAQVNATLGGEAPRTGVGTVLAEPPSTNSADIVVMASGCLGLVYFREGTERATREQIEQHHPGLIDGVAGHEGIGFVLVATGEPDADGEVDGVALGYGGSIRLSDGAVEGISPLEPYGPLALEQVRRHHSFANVPDLLVMGAVDPETGDVPAFEELIGSHGGMGGEQTEPFVLFPRELEYPQGDELVGAVALHRVLKSWTPAGRSERSARSARAASSAR